MKQNKTQITTSAYQEMLKTVGSKTADAGGLLFGTTDDYVVQKFVYDKDAVTTRSTYTFNAPYLNTMIDKMREEHLELIGFFHSHPAGATQLSSPDRAYFKSQFKNFPNLDRFVVPLMFPAIDGTYDFIPFVIDENGEIEETELELLPDTYQAYIERQPELLPPIPIEVQRINPYRFTFKRYYLLLWSAFLTGGLVLSLSIMWLGYQYMYNHSKINKIWTLVE